MKTVTGLSLVAALLALVWTAVTSISLKHIRVNVDRLIESHETGHNRTARTMTLDFLPAKRETTAHVEAINLPPPTYQRFIILGYRSENVVMDNLPNAGSVASKEFTVEIPTGTTDIIPLSRGSIALFGQITARRNDDTNFDFGLEDHHFGFNFVNVYVVEINQVTARLRADMLLRDENGDDPWSGVVNVTLLFLGPHP